MRLPRVLHQKHFGGNVARDFWSQRAASLSLIQRGASHQTYNKMSDGKADQIWTKDSVIALPISCLKCSEKHFSVSYCLALIEKVEQEASPATLFPILWKQRSNCSLPISKFSKMFSKTYFSILFSCDLRLSVTSWPPFYFLFQNRQAQTKPRPPRSTSATSQNMC